MVTKVNATDSKIPSTSGLVTGTQYDLDKQGLEKKFEDVDKKIPNSSGLVKKTDWISDDFCLVTKPQRLKTKYLILLIWLWWLLWIQKPHKFKCKIPDIPNLAIKTALNPKVTEIENKILDTIGFINTQQFNRLTKISFDARMEKAAKKPGK